MNLLYAIYKNARNASWQCLIDCKISELPVNPISIAKLYGLHCVYNNTVLNPGESGRIVKLKDGKIIILINPSQTPQRQAFTILHELGHYLLGHLGDTPLSRSYDSIRPEEEQAADRFATDVLMPACALWGLNIHTPEDIASLCNVSMQAAQIRARRMEELYRRNMFLSHPLERQVFQQFQHFFNNVRNNKN